MYDPWGVGHIGQLVSESHGDTFPPIFGLRNTITNIPRYLRTNSSYVQMLLTFAYKICLNLKWTAQNLEIIKIVATRYHNLRLKYTKFDFGWGSAPDSAGGTYIALSKYLAGFQGLWLLLTGGRQREGRGGAKGKRRGWEFATACSSNRGQRLTLIWPNRPNSGIRWSVSTSRLYVAFTLRTPTANKSLSRRWLQSSGRRGGGETTRRPSLYVYNGIRSTPSRRSVGRLLAELWASHQLIRGMHGLRGIWPLLQAPDYGVVYWLSGCMESLYSICSCSILAVSEPPCLV